MESFVDGSTLSLSRRELDETVLRRAAALRASGARGGVIGLCLPSNSELALDVLAAMAVGCAAPMNPDSTEAECRAYLAKLAPELMVTEANSVAATVARELDIKTLDPGTLALNADADRFDPPDPAAVALLLPTSGTTGNSKLVPLTHENLSASARNIAESLQLTENDRCLCLMPFYHVHGLVAGLLAPLLSGGSVIAVGGFDPSRLRFWLEDLDPTWYTAVPTIHRAVVDQMKRESPVSHRLRFARSCSASLPPQLMSEVEEILQVPLVEAYGMTEASHQIATNPLPPRIRKPGTVGLASGTTLALLTEGLVHTQPRQVGEVVIMGSGVTAGYLDNSAANEAAFHQGWLRTGDLGELDDDGYLHLSGRIKEMINRGGEKISPHEVEECLLEHPGVAEAVVYPLPHPTLGEDVAAVVVLRVDHVASREELTAFASAHLATRKVPRTIVFVDRIPLGRTGKPQRNRLAEQLQSLAASSDEKTDAGRSDVHAIWNEILDLEFAPLDADFFTLGGDSLRAMALVVALEQRLSLSLPLTFFSEATVTLRRLEGAVSRTSDPSDLEQPTCEPAVSFSEEAVLALSQIDREGALCNVPIALQIEGPIDHKRLEAALRAVVNRHEALRTSFPLEGGRRTRSIAPPTSRMRLAKDRISVQDLSAALRAECRRPFDVEKGPLFRSRLFLTNSVDAVLLFTAHHSVMDGLSQDLLLEALADSYREGSHGGTTTATLSLIAHGQQVGHETDALDRQRDYWCREMALLPEPIDLLDGPRDPEHFWAGDTINLEFDEALSNGIRSVASRERTTPFVVFWAAVAATLSRVSGAPDIVIGTPGANRHRRDRSKVIGLLANMLPLRLDLSGDPSFAELISRARRKTLGALANQEYPYKRLLDELHFDGSQGPDPLFGVICQLRRIAPLPLFGAEFSVTRMPVHTGTAKVPISFDMRDDGSKIRGNVEFNAAMFELAFIKDLCARLQGLLTAAVFDIAAPLSQLPILKKDECLDLITAGRGAESTPSATTVVDLIATQCAASPTSTAVLASGKVMTYGALNHLSLSIANALRSRGIGRGDFVGIMPARDEQMVALILGILQSGAAYVPLDSSYPSDRLSDMAEIAKLKLVVQSGGARSLASTGLETISIAELLLSDVISTPILPQSQPEDIACVLFTSGSTGRPKAVAIPHSALSNVVSWTVSTFSEDEISRVLVSASLNFDFSLFEIYPTLGRGGALVVVENILELRDVPPDVTMIASVPAALGPLIDSGAVPASVRTIVSGGEPLSRELVRRVTQLPQRPRLVNIYGPTETTVLCSAADIDGCESVAPIGHPIDGALLMVMDPLGNPLPVGYPGELWVGGKGVAQGYLNDPEMTRDCFREVDLPGLGRERMYKTGDLIHLGADRNFYFIRRVDEQVKIRGRRIEPGEIEAALLAHSGVAEAAAYAVGSGADRQLHAAITARNGPLDIDELRTFLEVRLPGFMVPERFLVLDRLPVTSTGKVDRRRLTGLAEASASTSHPAKGDNLEDVLLSTWSWLLQVPGLDVDSDFFAAGGNSLLAFMMTIEVERRLGLKLPLAWLADKPLTVRRLALRAYADSPNYAEEGSGATAAVIRPVRGDSQLSPVFLIYADAPNAVSARFVADAFGAGRPIYTMSPDWAEVTSLGEIIDNLAAVISEVPGEVIHLAGHSLGGVVAYELSSRLEATGRRVGMVALVDTIAPGAGYAVRKVRLRRRLRLALGIQAFWRKPAPAPEKVLHEFPFERAFGYLREYSPTALHRHIDLLTTASSRRSSGALLGWDQVHRGELSWHTLPGDHLSVLQPPDVLALAQVLGECVAATESVNAPSPSM